MVQKQDPIDLKKSKLYLDVKEQILKELSYEQMKKDMLKELREELKIAPIVEEEPNFFNKNPLLAFALFSAIILFLYRVFIN